MKLFNIAIIGFLTILISISRAEDTKSFPIPEWLSWLRVDYPARFEMDPKSLQGEAKWWAKFDDPDSDLSFELIAYGFISDLELLRTVPGYNQDNTLDNLKKDGRSLETIIAADAKQKNIGDYFRAHILPKGSEESKFPGYDRFIWRKNDGVVVYFLDSDAYKDTAGRCYQQLVFNFPAGSYENYSGVIESITLSAKPPYQTSEQGGAGQPATRSKSDSEGGDKPQPESDRRSL